MQYGSRRVSVSGRVRLRIASVLALLLLLPRFAVAGPYVTEPSGIRWNDVGGIRWNDVGGIRWNDVGGIDFDDVSPVSIDLELLDTLSTLPDSSAVDVVVSYFNPPTQADLFDLTRLGIAGGEIFHALPMVAVNATKDQIHQIASLTHVRSVYSNRTLSILDHDSADLIGVGEMVADGEIRLPDGRTPTGAGVTIAVLDSGVDGTHPDLPYGSKVVENVRLTGLLVPTGPGFIYPPVAEGIANTDVVLGHGTSVASVAAGTGAASGGLESGIAPGARILGLSAGDFFMVHVLEGLDYILANTARFGVRVVNCSWGTSGWFDGSDPVNIATRMLYDAGITVVFAAGNNGPAPDTLNPYSVAPWVIGVGSTRKDGKLSDFSSRGIYEELLYHPRLVAPGEEILTARAGALGQDGDTSPYVVESGTSFAAPHVAGVVALMLEANPGLTPGQINEILQRTATPALVRDRSEVGAGRVDAWAAVLEALDPARPFGTHVAGWLDQRPYCIRHGPARDDRYTLPSGGTLSIPAVVDGGANDAWDLGLAWSGPGVSDLDVRLLDAGGHEIARSDALNGAGLFGRVEGIHLMGGVPSEMNIEVSFKTGSDVASQDFSLRQETAVAEVKVYPDMADLTPSDLDTVTRAIRRDLITMKDRKFGPSAPLERGDLARALALASGLPQRIPLASSFDDVLPGNPLLPYVETVAGAHARRVLMDAPRLNDARPRRIALRPALAGSLVGHGFDPAAPVQRIDFAIALVRAAGKQAEAESRAGQTLSVADRRRIPTSLAGYVAVAMENGLIGTVTVGNRVYFDPWGPVSRLEASRRLLTLLQLLR